MPLLLVEIACSLLALAAALWMSPWRMLAPGGRLDLWTPLLGASLLLPYFWSWTGTPHLLAGAMAQLALLLLGWPLAVLALAATTAAGWLAGAELHEALRTLFWHGLLPVTIALGAGALLRRGLGVNPIGYMAGRAFLVPLLVGAGIALFAPVQPALLAEAGGARVAAAFLVGMLGAMTTAPLVVLLVACRPQWVATWADTLYLRAAARRA